MYHGLIMARGGRRRFTCCYTIYIRRRLLRLHYLRCFTARAILVRDGEAEFVHASVEIGHYDLAQLTIGFKFSSMRKRRVVAPEQRPVVRKYRVRIWV